MNIVTAPFTLASILHTELPYEVSCYLGGGEYASQPLMLEEVLPFAFYCLLALAVFAQLFVKPLRRLYARCFRYLLGLIRLRSKQAESAQLLADALARYLFTGGLCSLPLGLFLYHDTFEPSLGGPLNMGFALVGLFFTLLLLALAFVVFGIWLILRWQQLHRVPKVNPLASAVAAHVPAPATAAAETPRRPLWPWMLLGIGLLLGLALWLGSWHAPLRQLRQLDINDSAFHEMGGLVDRDAQSLITHYGKTGDATITSPHLHLTMLHLAAVRRDLRLTVKLLEDGADPNSRLRTRSIVSEGSEPGDTPLTLALRPVSCGAVNTTRLISFIQLLAEHGADPNIPGHEGKSALLLCAESLGSCRGHGGETSGEEVALELMRLGARGGQAEAQAFIFNGWARALTRLLEISPQGETLRREPALLQHCAAPFSGYEFGAQPGAIDCARLLLPQHERAQADQLLQTLCLHLLSRGQDAIERPDCYDFVALLLEQGADPRQPMGAFGKSCAADVLVADAGAREALRARGLLPEAPAHRFEVATLLEQVLDIPTDAVTDAEARGQYELLATLLTRPEPGQLAPHPLLYHQACARLLPLLHRADADRTRALLMELPGWQPEAWQAETPTQARGLLYALQQHAGVILPADFLHAAALRFNAAGRVDVAHALIRLLERDPQAGELIDSLCAEETPEALRAAAWTCRLHRAGLPSLGGGEVWRFFSSKYRISQSELPEPVRCAILADDSARVVCDKAPLITPERLCYTDADTSWSKPDARTLQALEQLPAPLAAAWYSRGEGERDAASLELELALAAYIWQHRERFYHPVERTARR